MVKGTDYKLTPENIATILRGLKRLEKAQVQLENFNQILIEDMTAMCVEKGLDPKTHLLDTNTWTFKEAPKDELETKPKATA